MNETLTKSETTSHKALVAGSFDPFTNGHLSIVKQASEIFDEVHVVIFANSAKQRRYPVDEMLVQFRVR